MTRELRDSLTPRLLDRSLTCQSINPADTAWMLVSTALVLLMTPALAFFYGGLVRNKNSLNTMMMSFVALGVVGVTWALAAYSLAFSDGGPFLGGLANLGLQGVGTEAKGTIPHVLFMAYQATFAIITAALISGAVVERMRFGPYVAFITPLDPAGLRPGGALGLGRRMAHEPRRARLRRRDRGAHQRRRVGPGRGTGARLPEGLRTHRGPASQRPLRAAGRGPALVRLVRLQRRQRAGGQRVLPALAFTNTFLAPAATLVVWTLLDYFRTGKATAVGGATGIVVGLVAVTPAAGFISPLSALILGAIAAFPSYFIIQLRSRTRIDDSLDVFAGHGVGGLTGALLTGVLAQKVWNSAGSDGLLFGNPHQLAVQALACLSAAAYAGIMTFAILKALSLVLSLRAVPRIEGVGMDVSQHGEEAYASGEGSILVHPDVLAAEELSAVLVPATASAR